MTITHLHLLPLATFALIPSTILISYIIAILLKHVDVDFPYISDSGTLSPESNIFGQLLNITSFLALLCVYVRFKQVEQFFRDHLSSDTRRIMTLNSVAYWMGSLASFGMSVVANFQETAILEVHLVGAGILFGFGIIYVWLQTVMSYKMQPLLNTLRMARLRLTLSILSTIGFIATVVFAGISLFEFRGDDKKKWTPKDGGFAAHVISAASEWILALAFDFYFLSYVKEFQQIAMESPKIYFVGSEDYGLPTTEMFNNDNVEIANGASTDTTMSQDRFDGRSAISQRVTAVVH